MKIQLDNDNIVIGIIGSRKRDFGVDRRAIADAFWAVYQDGDWICSGGAIKGGDSFAYYLHKDYAIPYLEFPAEWKKYGKKAGFMRNHKIAEACDLLIAAKNKDKAGGTEDTINSFCKKLNMTEKQAWEEGLLLVV